MTRGDTSIKGVVRSLGLVFGDIGTSPIYTLTVIFLLTPRTEENVMGVLSLVIWTLTTLVSVEYAWLAMSLGEKGEGGEIVLRSILLPFLKTGRQTVFVTIMTFIGISLLIGDGVITPAISILSAVEGTLLIPGFEQTGRNSLIFVAATISIILFTLQRRGAGKVAGAFGPITLFWFLALSVSGVVSMVQNPGVLKAVTPYYGLSFLYHNGISGFFVLSEVILCATGAEALFADMGHLGREPIRRAWYFVFVALILNYMGQAAFLLRNPGGLDHVLFTMVFHQSSILYIPFLILSIIATVIASQAVISSVFSIIYQGINMRLLPLMKISYTSPELRAQIYIGSINWFLLAAVLFIMCQFKESNRLAAAYGLAVTGSMTLTAGLMTAIFLYRRHYTKASVALLVATVDIAFLTSNIYKIPHGGYWSLVIAAVPLSAILIYTAGQRKLYRSLRPLKLDVFLESYNQLYQEVYRIRGTGLFFARDTKRIPPYMVHTMFMNNIVYTDNIIVNIITLDEPFGKKGSFREELAPGLRVFEIRVGYMEVINLGEIMAAAGINEKGIFYGLEEINSRNMIWKIFAVFKKLAPPFIHFQDLPANKLHGVVTRVEM